MGFDYKLYANKEWNIAVAVGHSPTTNMMMKRTCIIREAYHNLYFCVSVRTTRVHLDGTTEARRLVLISQSAV